MIPVTKGTSPTWAEPRSRLVPNRGRLGTEGHSVSEAMAISRNGTRKAGWILGQAAVCLFVIVIAPASAQPPDSSKGSETQVRSIAFDDVAASAGVSFRFETGSRGKHDLPEVMGGGVAIFDADGDRLLDIYLCNGGPIVAAAGEADPTCR